MENKFLKNIRPEIKNKINVKDYDFLVENKYLNNNICYLTYGGSFAYGTNVETSDVDIRGISTNTPEEILLGKDHEEVVNNITDTTIYTVKKLFTLLKNVNPNTIELLFTRNEDIIFINEIGKIIRENRNIFLSKRCIQSFGGYAKMQLYKLGNKCAQQLDDTKFTDHIIDSMYNAAVNFESRYGITKDQYKIIQKEDNNIYIQLKNGDYKLENIAGMIKEISNVKRDYDKQESKRNKYAVEHGKITKHQMHLYRLYIMCEQLLKTGTVDTYRKEEHNMLMDIRNGKYIDANKQPTADFMKMVDEKEKLMKELAKTTKLPDEPNYEAIETLQKNINKRIFTKNIILLFSLKNILFLKKNSLLSVRQKFLFSLFKK